MQGSKTCDKVIASTRGLSTVEGPLFLCKVPRKNCTSYSRTYYLKGDCKNYARGNA